MENIILQITAKNALVAFNKSSAEIRGALTNLFPDFNFSQDITEIVTSYEAACEVVGISPLTLDSFSFLPEEDQDSAFAAHQIGIIARAVNGDWIPDYADGNQYKYYPYFIWDEAAAGGPGFSYDGYGFDDSDSGVGARLVFKSRELAIWAGKTFIDIYNRFLKPYHA